MVSKYCRISQCIDYFLRPAWVLDSNGILCVFTVIIPTTVVGKTVQKSLEVFGHVTKVKYFDLEVE